MTQQINSIRSDFPILQQKVYNKPLVYFDNGATTQKPRQVIEKINQLYSENNSNIHRGVHYLSGQMTNEYEEARKTVQQFINAELSSEIVFTNGTTGSINLVAFSFGEKYVKEGDEILVSGMEHHANIIPWQLLCERKNAKLRVIPVTEKGELNLEEYENLLSEKTKLVAVTHVSNVLGTINPVKEIIRMAHEKDIPVLVDGAQSVQHQKIDVKKLGCDFFVFSGHKMYGPTGIGILYGRYNIMKELPPYQGGGDMVDCVKFEGTTYNELPFIFEAGTTNYIGAIGLAEAIKYLDKIGMDQIEKLEQQLGAYAKKKLESFDGIKIYGESDKKASIFSFLLTAIHPYDAGMILDKMGIAIRTGTHCAQPLMDRFDIAGTIRASLCFYNTKEEVNILMEGLKKVKQLF